MISNGVCVLNTNKSSSPVTKKSACPLKANSKNIWSLLSLHFGKWFLLASEIVTVSV
jgi:hypothetical protein